MPDHFYVYPAYLTGASRAAGRRVAQRQTVRADVTLEEILSAVKSLGFRGEIEPKQYPRAPWKGEGRVKVMKKSGVTKEAALRQLAAALAKTKPAH